MADMKEFLRQEYQVNGEIVSRNIAGESFLIPIRGKLADMRCIFSLNPVAEFIWQQLNAQNSLEEIRNRVVESFAVEQRQADEDLRDFVEGLLQAGLIKGVQ